MKRSTSRPKTNNIYISIANQSSADPRGAWINAYVISRQTCAPDHILRAVEHEVIHYTTMAAGEYECGQNRTHDVHPNQHRGDIDRVAPHPRNWTIIIGGSHSEHAFN